MVKLIYGLALSLARNDYSFTITQEIKPSNQQFIPKRPRI